MPLHSQPQTAEGAAQTPGIFGSEKGSPTSNQLEALACSQGQGRVGVVGIGTKCMCQRRWAGLRRG